ncbi:Gamma-glutamylcyclotransferase family protein ytfP [Serratia rubidaea]|uniref:Gamma-glutamylcyclotransferase family protein ytfP n=1 Tax=Serratia rubidaea TaxID=61652 RepID=A0A4U9H8M2_SERRU|nr:Gamma-glutamylcyclotransferase family protein ytfP [Serratia rubidaea]
MRIIVYGSLRRKQGNSHWMTNAQWLGEHELEGYQIYNLGHYRQRSPVKVRYIARCIVLMHRFC